MSHDIHWDIRQDYCSGTSGYAEFVCFGYKRGDDGWLTIDKPEAEMIRKIFEMRAEGHSLGFISGWLHEHEIPSPTRKSHWSREMINKLLRNEKYVGDISDRGSLAFDPLCAVLPYI